MTQAELGRRIDRNPVWVSRYFDAAYDADLDTLARMAEALGHTLFEVLDLTGDEGEQRMNELYRTLSPSKRKLVVSLLEGMLSDPPKARRSSGTR